MSKIAVDISENFCPHPQALFLYGTYKEDGTPNFGLFCWFNFCWNNKELYAMACIDGEKVTKDRIQANGVFSANLVTEQMLPLADYLGHTNSYKQDNVLFDIETIPGSVLQVPIFKNSPWSYELEVSKTISLNGSEIYITQIRNVLAEKKLIDNSGRVEFSQVSPVVTTMETYYSLERRGSWGEWNKK